MVEKFSTQSASENILESFLILASEKGGPGSVTLQMVAKKSKLAFGTVRYHFSSPEKPSLEEAAIQYVFKKSYEYHDQFIIRARANSKDTFNPLHAYIDSMLGWAQLYPIYAQFIVYFFYLWTTHFGKKKYEKLKDNYYQTVFSRIDSFLHEAIGRGHYSTIKNTELCVQLIYDLILSECLRLAMNLGAQSLQQRKNICKQTIDKICRGFAI
jgi:hypothetical protein